MPGEKKRLLALQQLLYFFYLDFLRGGGSCDTFMPVAN